MSLVGTRPPTVDEWDKYELHHRARLATKPGLTGMWQVSGRSDITDLRLGFEIPLNVFGKGLHIFHTGNIIINETSSVGEYCNIIGSTCLGSKDGGNGPTIGNHCELGMNSVVIGNVKIGNNVYIGAGAVVTKSFEQNGVSLAGVPAKIVASRKDSKKAD